jgi:hypothetical protein
MITKATYFKDVMGITISYSDAADKQIGIHDDNEEYKQWRKEGGVPEMLLSEAEQAVQYKLDRVYPTIEEQLDDIYHNGITGWKSTIKAVKDADPKPI